MNQKAPQRRGLGRGLGSLIPSGPVAEPAPTPVPTGPDWIGRLPDPDGTAPEGTGPGGTGQDGTGPDHTGHDGMGAASRGGTDAEAGTDGHQAHGEETVAEAGPEQADAGLRTVEGAYFAELPVSAVVPNPRQPRQVFDEEAMAELVHSVKEVGLLQPVVVRVVAEGRYELVMGERRWRAIQAAGLETIPAIVRETGDDALLRDALLENLHRAQLNPLEEAAAYQQLLEDFGCTHEELAARIGRSRPQISNMLRLLKLTPAVQRRVAAGVLSAGHARTLLSVEDADAQDRLAGRVVAEGISVRGLEELVTVGGAEGSKPRARRAASTPPVAGEVAARLGDLYDTRVRVDLGRSKGRITIEFASLEDLNRIVAAMDPSYRPQPD